MRLDRTELCENCRYSRDVLFGDCPPTTCSVCGFIEPRRFEKGRFVNRAWEKCRGFYYEKRNLWNLIFPFFHKSAAYNELKHHRGFYVQQALWIFIVVMLAILVVLLVYIISSLLF